MLAFNPGMWRLCLLLVQVLLAIGGCLMAAWTKIPWLGLLGLGVAALSAMVAEAAPTSRERVWRWSLAVAWAGTLAAFGGLVMESMTRGDGWRFLDMGRRIERAWQVVDLIRQGLGFACPRHSGQLEILLEIADSSITYRSRYLTSMQTDDIARAHDAALKFVQKQMTSADLVSIVAYAARLTVWADFTNDRDRNGRIRNAERNIAGVRSDLQRQSRARATVRRGANGPDLRES